MHQRVISEDDEETPGTPPPSWPKSSPVLRPTPTHPSIFKSPRTRALIDRKNDYPLSSDLSDIVDQGPPRKNKMAKKRLADGGKVEGERKSKAASANSNAQQAEIKRLQSWLVKCGIRKMWHRELAPFDTSRAKILHLKTMLSEAGLEGRISIEKANRIRQRRELKDDLVAVQEGARRWGDVVDDVDDIDNSSAAGPGARKSGRRRLVRGVRKLDCHRSDGVEESD